MSVEIKNLSYYYSPATPHEKQALKNISLTINEGDFFGIVGHTGSGKTTLVHHINALTRVQKGKIKLLGKKKIIANEDCVLNVLGYDLAGKVDLKELRRRVGMVFQYPEHQLFADTVFDDVAFGLKNFGTLESEIAVKVQKAIELVGLDYEQVKDRSPFELSGGQKRRVALAGVIVTSPEVLVLDEPTAGLDYQGAKDILNLICQLKRSMSTIIMISHNMDEVASYCNRVALFKDGEVVKVCLPSQLFGEDIAKSNGLDYPLVTKLSRELKDAGLDVEESMTEEQLELSILKAVKR